MTDDPLQGDGRKLPDTFEVAVILKRWPASSPWVDYQWDVVGVAPGAGEGLRRGPVPERVSEHGEVTLFRADGFRVKLHVDECESYYHNLLSPTPRCFVIAEPDAGQGPVPFRVSLSFDEAHAYLEGEREVYAVDIPPELYRWSEAFVLRHYVPEPKRKRKLRNWSSEDAGSEP